MPTKNHLPAPVTKEEAAEQLLPIARRIGRRMARVHGRGLDLSEIDGAAHLGLADALSRFDPERAHVFSSYAVQRIRGAVFDELRRRDPRSRYAREQREKVRDVARDLEASTGLIPSEAGIAEALGMSIDRVRDQVAAGATIKLVPLADSDDGSEPVSAFPVEVFDPFQSCERSEVLTRVAAAFDSLEPRDRDVVRAYFFEERTLAEIAEQLGVTEARVSQLVTRAVSRIRDRIGGTADDLL